MQRCSFLGGCHISVSYVITVKYLIQKVLFIFNTSKRIFVAVYHVTCFDAYDLLVKKRKCFEFLDAVSVSQGIFVCA